MVIMFVLLENARVRSSACASALCNIKTTLRKYYLELFVANSISILASLTFKFIKT